MSYLKFLFSNQKMKLQIMSSQLKYSASLCTRFNSITNHYLNKTSNKNYMYFSNMPQRPPSFIGKVLENLKEEMQRDKKFKKSMQEFQRDMEELDKSEALQKAREKYKSVEEETADGAKKAKIQFDSLRKKVVEEANKAEILQKASKVTEEATKQAQKVTDTISQKGEELSKTEAYKKISEAAKVVRDEFDKTTFGKGSQVYQPPTQLFMRKQRDHQFETKIIEANTKAHEVVLHKDSIIMQKWENFKTSSPYITRVMEWRTKIDESDNLVVRASILFKDKTSELFGGMFQKTELSHALTEICKMDPSFDKERFLLECEYLIIPNILEALIRPDLKILDDWCYERAFHALATPIKQAIQLGYKFKSRVLDIDNVELVLGQVIDEGPILLITFQTQQIECILNSTGEVVEGDMSKVLRINHHWVFCRDQTELNHQTAWRLMEAARHVNEQLL